MSFFPSFSLAIIIYSSLFMVLKSISTYYPLTLWSSSNMGPLYIPNNVFLSPRRNTFYSVNPMYMSLASSVSDQALASSIYQKYPEKAVMEIQTEAVKKRPSLLESYIKKENIKIYKDTILGIIVFSIVGLSTYIIMMYLMDRQDNAQQKKTTLYFIHSKIFRSTGIILWFLIILMSFFIIPPLVRRHIYPWIFSEKTMTYQELKNNILKTEKTLETLKQDTTRNKYRSKTFWRLKRLIDNLDQAEIMILNQNGFSVENLHQIIYPFIKNAEILSDKKFFNNLNYQFEQIKNKDNCYQKGFYTSSQVDFLISKRETFAKNIFNLIFMGLLTTVSIGLLRVARQRKIETV